MIRRTIAPRSANLQKSQLDKLNDYFEKTNSLGKRPVSRGIISKQVSMTKLKKIQKVPGTLKIGEEAHTLNSINESVALKYMDRPYKLKDHLPFNNLLIPLGEEKTLTT